MFGFLRRFGDDQAAPAGPACDPARWKAEGFELGRQQGLKEASQIDQAGVYAQGQQDGAIKAGLAVAALGGLGWFFFRRKK